MNRRKDPSYRLHKQSGQAIVTLPDGIGSRRDVLLGEYDSPESWEEYNRVLAEWRSAGHQLLPKAGTKYPDIAINELILRFWPHVEEHYRRPDGTPTSEVESFRLSFRPLKRLYGRTFAKDFGPLALKAVRDEMIDGSWLTHDEKRQYGQRGKPIGWSRLVVNQRVGRIVRLFRWGVENELVPPHVIQSLQAVRGLARGRCRARENPKVKAVPEQYVRETLPFMLPPVAAMVQLQLATGMRPGEVVIMRGFDLDTKGTVWLYRPGSDQGEEGAHKTAWRGHTRIIAIGPAGQEILKPWLRLNLQEYLFSPRDAVAIWQAEKRRNRKTRVQPSQVNRRVKKSRVQPGDRYTVRTYNVAVARACRKADRAAHEKHPEIPAEQIIIPHWHPNQLRHTKATEIRREAGLDAARVVLGHRSPQITEVYAEIDVNKAAEVMARLG